MHAKRSLALVILPRRERSSQARSASDGTIFRAGVIMSGVPAPEEPARPRRTGLFYEAAGGKG